MDRGKNKDILFDVFIENFSQIIKRVYEIKPKIFFTHNLYSILENLFTAQSQLNPAKAVIGIKIEILVMLSFSS